MSKPKDTSPKMPGTTISVDEWTVKADHCRAFLHIHGMLSDSENQKVKERIVKALRRAYV